MIIVSNGFAETKLTEDSSLPVEVSIMWSWIQIANLNVPNVSSKSTSAPCCGRVSWKLFVRKSWICDLRDQQPGGFAQHGCVALRRTLPNTNNTFLDFLNFNFSKTLFCLHWKKIAYKLFQRHRRKEFTEKDKCDRTPLKTTTHWLEHELYFSSFFKPVSYTHLTLPTKA